MKEQRRTRTEDYLAAIESICAAPDCERATTSAVAREIGVTTGTASSVLKSLAADGLVDLVPYGGAALTELGRQRARRMTRRCQILAVLLCQMLNFDADEATDEAWRLERAASDNLIDRIDEYLGQPAADATGQVIPRADGSLPGEPPSSDSPPPGPQSGDNS